MKICFSFEEKKILGRGDRGRGGRHMERRSSPPRFSDRRGGGRGGRFSPPRRGHPGRFWQKNDNIDKKCAIVHVFFFKSEESFLIRYTDLKSFH